MTAAAHKPARIVYHMVANKKEYDAAAFQEQERKTQDRKRFKLLAQAKELGFQLVPVEAAP
jgi:hypothetical protein